MRAESLDVQVVDVYCSRIATIFHRCVGMCPYMHTYNSILCRLSVEAVSFQASPVGTCVYHSTEERCVKS